MKNQVILLLLLSLSGLYLYQEQSTTNTNTFLQATEDPEIQVFKSFQAWKTKFNQNFNSKEEEFRFQVFKSNFNFVNEHNASGDQLVLGMNAFGAMHLEEFASRYLKTLPRKTDDITFKNTTKSNNAFIPIKKCY